MPEILHDILVVCNLSRTQLLLDVRARAATFLKRRPFPLACMLPVSPHVNAVIVAYAPQVEGVEKAVQELMKY
jgi:hypothetical protein